MQTFDRRDLGAFAHGGVGNARAGRLPIYQHSAGAAGALFAAQVRRRQIALVAEEVGQMRARLDIGGDGAAIDGDMNLGHEFTARA